MKRLIRRILHGPPTDIEQLINKAAAFPRYARTSLSFRGYSIEVTDMRSVAWQLKEFFGDERMRFTSVHPDPLIIDCGANVGVSVLYYKQLFPKARVICFEPDEQVFDVLKKNMNVNGLIDVICRQEAVWVHTDGVSFGSEGADSGSILRTDNVKRIPSVRLKEVLLAQPRIDLLKVDIEGAECDVLLDCGEALQKVRNLYVEYHSFPSLPQRLHDVLAMLTANGFRYYIHRIGVYHKHPFAGLEPSAMDMQLDIHAVRV